MSTQSDIFYDENPKYRCCCQFCHVRKGTIAVAIGSFVFATYFLIKSFAFFARGQDDYRATTVLTFIISIIWIVVSIVLLIGVWKEKPVFLVPFMVVQIPLIILAACLGILCIVYLAVGRAVVLGPTGASDREPRTLKTHEDHLHMLILVGVQAIVYGLMLAFGIWFYMTVLQCYRWLKEKKMPKENGHGYNLTDIRSTR